MTWRIHSGHGINKHISFFKTGLWSHLSPPSPKEQPHGVSAPGSTRLSSFPAKAFSQRQNSWILLCSLATTPSNQSYFCTHQYLFSSSWADWDAKSKPSTLILQQALAGLCSAVGSSMHLKKHTVCLLRLLVQRARGSQAWRMWAMQSTWPGALQQPVCLGRCSQSPVQSWLCEMQQADFVNCSWASCQFLCNSALMGVRTLHHQAPCSALDATAHWKCRPQL